MPVDGTVFFTLIHSLEEQLEVFWSSVNLKFKLFLKVPKDCAAEGDLDGLVSIRHHDTLRRIEMKARPEHGLVGHQAEDGVDVSFVG